MDSSNAFGPGYLLTKIGQVITLRFSAALEPLGIRPKHFGLMAAVASMPASTQQDLGRALGLVPSAIVEMIDDLQTLGALRRAERPNDRRSHLIELTPSGQELLAKAAEAGREVDESVLAPLSPAKREALASSVAIIGAELGIAGS
ncbi:MarR family winged helix-turn-helix transcriptional regulator [uncultured Microbacterium sp.]|uniref:MarR family winged helix-turn-helix transcriptional regulator n=1 Tax=uncultured Microbacterium sp. TaxID=191216 RepID=UPI0035C9F733